MNFMDKAKKAMDKYGPQVQQGLAKAQSQAEDALHKHAPTIQEKIDKAATAVDQKTGGKHSDKIAKAKEQIQQGVSKADNAAQQRRQGEAGAAGAADAQSPDPHTPGTQMPVQEPNVNLDGPTPETDAGTAGQKSFDDPTPPPPPGPSYN